MTHQVQIPDEMWDWAERQCKARGEGPAAFLRAIIIGAMANNGEGRRFGPEEILKRPQDARPPVTGKAKQAIIDVLEGRRIYAYACTAILEAEDWNFTDPAGKMNKPPEEVKDFLLCCRYEISMYADMFASRRNLLKMIFDAYMRAHGGWNLPNQHSWVTSD